MEGEYGEEVRREDGAKHQNVEEDETLKSRRMMEEGETLEARLMKRARARVVRRRPNPRTWTHAILVMVREWAGPC